MGKEDREDRADKVVPTEVHVSLISQIIINHQINFKVQKKWRTIER
jgi:hypothetical protein